MSDPNPTPRAPDRRRDGWSVPDKPTLDGLEATWRPGGQEQGTFRFDRTKTRDEIYSIDTPPPDGQRVAARRPRLQLHPHRHRRPLPAHAGQGGLLPDGVGRQRPAHRAPGPELLRRPVRPDLPYDPDFRPAGRSRASRPSTISRRNFVELCECLTVGRRGGLRGPLARPRPVGRLGHDLHHHRGPLAPRRPARLPAQPGPGRGLPGRGTRPVGRRLPHRGRPGRARGPRACPAPTTASPSTGPTASRS